ncbi:MAG: cell division protein FtsA [Candidatus Delongbacteria bacterium]|nr:cell division protein FtsA [Candidatus Delongbacteria bacterium]MBN2836830.1 cell division protein FtsA [Candidatus Delongbacteria bacterium]
MNVLGIDIGTNFIKGSLVRISEDGRFTLDYKLKVPSRGVTNGSISDIDSCAEAVKKCIDDIFEIDDSLAIDHVTVSYSGRSINCRTVSGTEDMWANSGSELPGRITNENIEKIISSIRMNESEPGKILHTFKQEFIIDDETRTYNPINMTGRRIKANVLLIADHGSNLHNVEQVMKKAGIEDFVPVYGPISTSEAILSEENKKGSIVIELGAGKIELVIYHDGCLRFAATLPLGSNYLNKDLMYVLQTDPDATEIAKVKYGSAIEYEGDENDTVTIKKSMGRGSEDFSLRQFCEITSARLVEIFELAIEMIYVAKYNTKIISPIILAGESTKLKNTNVLLRTMLNGHENERGNVKNIEKNESIPDSYFASIGSVMYAFRNKLIEFPKEKPRKKGIMGKFKNFIKDLL